MDDGDILAVVGESGKRQECPDEIHYGTASENAQTTADSLVYMGSNLLEFSADERRKMRGKRICHDFPGSDDSA